MVLGSYFVLAGLLQQGPQADDLCTGNWVECGENLAKISFISPPPQQDPNKLSIQCSTKRLVQRS